MELHHPIMSKIWDLGGQTKRKKGYISSVSVSSIFGPNGCHLHAAENILCRTWHCSVSAHLLGLSYYKESISILSSLADSAPALLMVGSACTIM